jgi:hypothetical protein
MCTLNNVGVETLVNLGRPTGALLNTTRPLPPRQGWYGFLILHSCVDVCCSHSRLSLHHEMAGGISARQVWVPDFVKDVPKQLNNISSDNICEGSCVAVFIACSVFPQCKIEGFCHIQTIPSH